jgi:hypothetical protein
VAKPPELKAPLGDLLTGNNGAGLFIGRLRVGLALELPGLRLVIDPLSRPRKLARQRFDPLLVLRADPLRIPLPPAALGSVVALDMLGRVPDPAAALGEWSRVLGDGGMLVVVERLANGAVPRALRRLAAPSRRVLAPEDVTGLMLNCGLVGIGQVWPAARFITVGRTRALPALQAPGVRGSRSAAPRSPTGSAGPAPAAAAPGAERQRPGPRSPSGAWSGAGADGSGQTRRSADSWPSRRGPDSEGRHSSS